MSMVGPAVIVRAVNSMPLTSSKNVPLPGHAGKFSGELDGAVTSQFENHLRAILGLPLGGTAARAPCVMANLIGAAPPVDELLALPGARVHLYGKEAQPGRKVGHVTLVDPDETTVERLVELAG